MRVAVFGNSCGVLVAGSRGDERPYVTYPAALARTKTEGAAFAVDNHCRIGGIVTDFSGVWLEPLSKSRPDIVVLQLGGYEIFPRWIPRPAVRRLMGINRHAGPVRDVVWHRANRLLLLWSKWAGVVDRAVPVSRGGYVSPARLEAELRLLCRRIRHQIGCRVVLMDAYLPSDKCHVMTPKMRRRLEMNNDAIRKVAQEMDLEVFPLGDIVNEMGTDVVLGDGMHLDDLAHRRVGSELASFLAAAPAAP